MDLWACGCILFALLSGYQPFYSPYVGQLIELIKVGEFSFSGSVWAAISEPAKDLVRQLLQPKPEKRANALAALVHPWLTQPDSEPRRFSELEFKSNLLCNQRRLTRRKISDNTHPVCLDRQAIVTRPCRVSMHIRGLKFEEFLND